MKKHLDWKRIGWTLHLIVGFIGSSFLLYYHCAQNWIYQLDNGINQPPQLMPECGKWLSSFAFGFLIWLGSYLIISSLPYIVSRISNFYYHNGESKNPHDYKLPLYQCKTCKVKQHCLAIKVKSCPNILGEVKSAKR